MNQHLFHQVKTSVLAELQAKMIDIEKLSYDDFNSHVSAYRHEEDPHGVIMHKIFYIEENSINHTIKTLF
jgi:hypothetical protein